MSINDSSIITSDVDSLDFSHSVDYSTPPLPSKTLTNSFKIQKSKPFKPQQVQPTQNPSDTDMSKPLKNSIDYSQKIDIYEKISQNFITTLKEFTDKAKIRLEFEIIPMEIGFQCTCKLNSQGYGIGVGKAKQETKKEAAKQTIIKLLKTNKNEYIGFFTKYIDVSVEKIQEDDIEKSKENNTTTKLDEHLKKSLVLNDDDSEDENSIKCKELSGFSPIFSSYTITSDQMISVRVSCGEFSAEGKGKRKKIAKEEAIQLLLKQLKEHKSNKLTELTQLTKKHKEKFIKFAEEKLKNILPNLLQDKAQNFDSLKERFKNYDKLHLEPKKHEISSLLSIYDELLSIFSAFSQSLNIETFLPVGSYLNHSLRAYKLELDVLAIYINNDKNPLEANKELIDKLKDCFLRHSEEHSNKYEVFIKEFRGNKCLTFALEDDFNTSDSFHVIKIYPCGKLSMKLQIGLRLDLEMMKSIDNMGLEVELYSELCRLRRILKYIRDNNWIDIKGDIIDIIIYNITKKFTDIDLIRNIKRFFEFIALGGLSSHWFWNDFPDFFLDYIQTDIPKSIVSKMEIYCLNIIKTNQFDFLIKT